MSKLEYLNIKGNILTKEGVDILKQSLQNNCCFLLKKLSLTAPYLPCTELKKAILQRGCPNFDNYEICILNNIIVLPKTGYDGLDDYYKDIGDTTLCNEFEIPSRIKLLFIDLEADEMMVIYKLFNYFKCINKLTIGGI